MPIPSRDTEPHAAEPTRIADVMAETTGFGAIEWRTFRDLLMRPRTVLDAYLERGPTGGGHYARPLGFYIALCGVLMFYMFLMNGMRGIIEQQPPAMLDSWIAQSGKSREAFIDDVDSWTSLVAVPILSVFYALGAAPLLKWWGGLDWRRTIRATFALLCAWTVPILPLGPLPLMPQFALIGAVVMWGALFAAFVRMGRGLWFRSWPGGVLKALALAVGMMVSVLIGMTLVIRIGLMGATYGS